MTYRTSPHFPFYLWPPPSQPRTHYSDVLYWMCDTVITDLGDDHLPPERRVFDYDLVFCEPRPNWPLRGTMIWG
jgi:hypothetical protein